MKQRARHTVKNRANQRPGIASQWLKRPNLVIDRTPGARAAKGERDGWVMENEAKRAAALLTGAQGSTAFAGNLRAGPTAAYCSGTPTYRRRGARQNDRPNSELGCPGWGAA